MADLSKIRSISTVSSASICSAMDQVAKPFVDALLRLPLPPEAVAALKAGDFDKRTRTLTVGKDKSGRTRQIMVPQERPISSQSSVSASRLQRRSLRAKMEVLGTKMHGSIRPNEL